MRTALRKLAPHACGFAAVAAVFAWAAVATACPTCGDAVGEADPDGLATGLNYSILFMMSMPYLIVGTLGTVVYRSIKRNQAAHADPNAD